MGVNTDSATAVQNAAVLTCGVYCYGSSSAYILYQGIEDASRVVYWHRLHLFALRKRVADNSPGNVWYWSGHQKANYRLPSSNF